MPTMHTPGSGNSGGTRAKVVPANISPVSPREAAVGSPGVSSGGKLPESPKVVNFEDRLKSIITSVLNEDQEQRKQQQGPTSSSSGGGNPSGQSPVPPQPLQKTPEKKKPMMMPEMSGRTPSPQQHPQSNSLHTPPNTNNAAQYHQLYQSKLPSFTSEAMHQIGMRSSMVITTATGNGSGSGGQVMGRQGTGQQQQQQSQQHGGMTVSAIHSPHAGQNYSKGGHKGSTRTSPSVSASQSSSASSSSSSHHNRGMEESPYKMQASHSLPMMYNHMDFGEKLRAESTKMQ